MNRCNCNSYTKAEGRKCDRLCLVIKEIFASCDSKQNEKREVSKNTSMHEERRFCYVCSYITSGTKMFSLLCRNHILLVFLYPRHLHVFHVVQPPAHAHRLYCEFMSCMLKRK